MSTGNVFVLGTKQRNTQLGTLKTIAHHRTLVNSAIHSLEAHTQTHNSEKEVAWDGREAAYDK